MTFFSDADRQQLAADYLSTLYETGTLSGTRNGVAFSVAVQGRFAKQRGSTNLNGGTPLPALVAEAELWFSVPPDTDVTRGDVLRFAGRIFDVVWAEPPTTLGVARTIALKENA